MEKTLKRKGEYLNPGVHLRLKPQNTSRQIKLKKKNCLREYPQG